MFYSKEVQIALLKYRIHKLSVNSVENANLIHKAGRRIRYLESL